MKMISLVSQQRMQNIIPIYQQGIEIDEVWLIRSTDADNSNSPFAKAWQNTKDVIQNCHDIEKAVNAYGIAETHEKVSRLLETKGAEQFIVNFTGGTKCMSIGAYLAAQQHGAKALYVDTANEKLIWFYPERKSESVPFSIKPKQLTVAIYLKSNGKTIDKDKTQQNALSGNAIQASRELLNIWPNCRGMLNRLGKEVSKGKTKVNFGKENHETIKILKKYGLITPSNEGGWEIPKEGKVFLTGKWLDAASYVLLKESDYFDDVLLNQYLAGVTNELDVLVTRNGQCAIIECKSGDLGGSLTLDKLEAIRSGFGLFARTFFVTSQNNNKVRDYFRARAKEYGVKKIITAENFNNLADIVKIGMSGVPR